MSGSRSSKERGYIFNTFLQAKKKFESLFHRSLLYKIYGLIFWFHCWLWSLRSYCFSELLELWPCFNACVYILTYLLTESDDANNEHEICKYCCALISFCHGLRYVTLRNTISAVRKSNKIANFKAKSRFYWSSNETKISDHITCKEVNDETIKKLSNFFVVLVSTLQSCISANETNRHTP